MGHLALAISLSRWYRWLIARAEHRPLSSSPSAAPTQRAVARRPNSRRPSSPPGKWPSWPSSLTPVSTMFVVRRSGGVWSSRTTTQIGRRSRSGPRPVCDRVL